MCVLLYFLIASFTAPAQGIRPIIRSVSLSLFNWSFDYNGDWCPEKPGEQIQFGLQDDIPILGDWSGDVGVALLAGGAVGREESGT